MEAHLGADAQALLQALLVLGHPQREVTVAPVHRAHPALQLRHVGVAFLHQVVGELDEQLHLLLGLLREHNRRENTELVRRSSTSEEVTRTSKELSLHPG